MFVCNLNKANKLYVSTLFGNKQPFSLFQKEILYKVEYKEIRMRPFLCLGPFIQFNSDVRFTWFHVLSSASIRFASNSS